MARVVVDSSVAIKWFIPESLSSHARRLLDDYESGSLDLLAPDLIYAELGNIVWKKQAVHGQSAEDAGQVIAALSALNFHITPSAVLLAEAYPLAVTHRRTVYDVLYLALSLRERCQFVSGRKTGPRRSGNLSQRDPPVGLELRSNSLRARRADGARADDPDRATACYR